MISHSPPLSSLCEHAYATISGAGLVSWCSPKIRKIDPVWKPKLANERTDGNDDDNNLGSMGTKGLKKK